MLNIYSVKIVSKLILSPFWSYCSISLQGNCFDFMCVLGTKILNQINVIENIRLYVYHNILGTPFIQTGFKI